MPTPKRLTGIKRNTYYTLRKVIEKIEDEILHLKNGYSFWFSFNSWKQGKIKKSFIDVILNELFNDDFRISAFKALLDDNGLVYRQSLSFYKWFVKVIYSNDENLCLKDWQRLKGLVDDANGKE